MEFSVFCAVIIVLSGEFEDFDGELFWISFTTVKISNFLEV